MEKEIDELLTRGVIEVIDKDDLKEKLHSGKKLRIKLGIDPTSPNIHIGRAVALWKLRAFQDLGHTAVFIIGDDTGVVGDTSDKDAERPMISKDEVKENMKGYFDQVFKILDKDKTETHHNSEWLSKLGLEDLAKMASHFGLHEFASRDVIARRIAAGQRVSVQELLYPLMQGYDSVAIKADVELGGNDQRFNLLTGRKIQPIYGQESQNIMMLEIIEGTDGRKMSSSWGNSINITDEPNNMYGKVMSVVDAQVLNYFKLCTRVSLDEIEKISTGLEDTTIHPKDAKMRLAREIVALYHGAESAQNAEENFIKTFSNKEIPEDILKIEVALGEKLSDILQEAGLVKSKSEFRTLVDEGAVMNMEIGEKIESVEQTAEINMTLKIGKRRFIKIEIA